MQIIKKRLKITIMDAKGKIDGLRGSERLRIMSTILKFLEDAGVDCGIYPELQGSQKPDVWEMTFLAPKITFQDVLTVTQKLGTLFSITILPDNKYSVKVMLSAHKSEFLRVCNKL